MYLLPQRLRRTGGSRRHAVIGAALVLVLGAGGATYAAGMITGADIKNGTVTSADVMNYSLKVKDFSPGASAGLVGPTVYSTDKVDDTVLNDSFTTVVSLTLPAGNYMASATGIVFEVTNADAFASCDLDASDTTVHGQSAATIPTGGLYASVVSQATFSAGIDTVLTFRCQGTNAGINNVTLTATRVGRLYTS